MQDYSALATYHQTAVSSESDSGLIVRLYDGMLRFLSDADAAIARGDMKEKGIALRRAGRIVEELNHALDHEVGGEIAAQLSALYDYLNYELTEANLLSDAGRVDNARRIVLVLSDAWRRVHESGAKENAADEAPLPDDAGAPTTSGLSVSA